MTNELIPGGDCPILSLVGVYFSTLKPNTRKTYMNGFFTYLDWGGCLDEQRAILPIAGNKMRGTTPKVAMAYLNYLQNLTISSNKAEQSIPVRQVDAGASYANKLSGNTIRAKLNALSAIWDELMLHEYVKANPWRLVIKKTSRDRNRKRHYKAFNFVDMVKILDAMPCKNMKERRDRLIIELFWVSGLRKSEVLRLRLKDAVWDDDLRCNLRINSPKGGADQNQILPRKYSDKLRKWVKFLDKCGAAPNNPLFPSYKNNSTTPTLWKGLSESTLGRLVKESFRNVGLEGSCHDLRKSAVNFLREQGFGIDELKGFLRHASVLTTERYLDDIEVDGDRLDEAFS